MENMDNWRNDIDRAAKAMGVDGTGNWRNDLHNLAEAIIAGGGGGGGGVTPAQVQQIVDQSLATYKVQTAYTYTAVPERSDSTATTRNIIVSGITSMTNILMVPITITAAVALGSITLVTINVYGTDGTLIGSGPCVFPQTSSSAMNTYGNLQWVKQNGTYEAVWDGNNFILSYSAGYLASTTQPGYVQAVSDLTSSSTFAVPTAAAVKAAIPESVIATVCPATTVNFAFSEDGSTFSFTGGTFLWLGTKNDFGVVTLNAAINVPYVTGRVLVMNVSNPNAPTITSRSINPAITFAENEYVIGNFFNYNTNPLTQTATVYGSGAYTWSATGGNHEAYGDISTSGTTLDLVLGDYTIRVTGGANAAVSVHATNSDIPNVDIRRFSIYGDASEGSANDNITLTTAGVVVDDTVLTSSNDSCIIWIGNGRTFIEVKVFISGAGARCRIVSSYMS